jgi:hypothetical protein
MGAPADAGNKRASREAAARPIAAPADNTPVSYSKQSRHADTALQPGPSVKPALSSHARYNFFQSLRFFKRSAYDRP